MLEMCLLKEKSDSNSTPRLRAWEDGEIEVPRNEKELSVILSLCCCVPMRRYSVFDGLTERRLSVSQE